MAEAALLLEKNAAFEYGCGSVLELLTQAVMLCDGRLGLAKGTARDAWRRHRAHGRETSRRAFATEAVERMDSV